MFGEPVRGRFERRRVITPQEHTGRDQRVDVADAQHALELRRTVGRAEEHRDGPDPCDREEGHRELGARRQHDADPRALADARGEQLPSKQRRLLVGLPEGEPLGRGDDVVVVAEPFGPARQQRRHGRRVVQLGDLESHQRS